MVGACIETVIVFSSKTMLELGTLKKQTYGIE